MSIDQPVDIRKILQTSYKTVGEFNFDNLYAPPIYAYLSPCDIEELREIVTSVKLATRIKVKLKRINEILGARGFRRFAGGTNRVVYACYEDPSILIKVAVDNVGKTDNSDEFERQFVLKPFCTKMFSVSPCGTVGLCERVIPITNIEEFKMVAEDIYNIIYHKIIGKYVIDDIGTKYFMNWGVRPGFGPVLLDYPYLYELDGDKLFCNKLMEDGSLCHGEIDYDIGFNHLFCQKCGKKYKAVDLKTDIDKNRIIIGTDAKGGNIMKVRIMRGNATVSETGPAADAVMTRAKKKKNTVPTIAIMRGDNEVVGTSAIEQKVETNIDDTIRNMGFDVEVVESETQLAVDSTPVDFCEESSDKDAEKEDTAEVIEPLDVPDEDVAKEDNSIKVTTPTVDIHDETDDRIPIPTAGITTRRSKYTRGNDIKTHNVRYAPYNTQSKKQTRFKTTNNTWRNHNK